MTLRGPPIALAAALLSACNTAMSDKPVFAEADRSRALQLEDGLWLRDAVNCAVEASAPYQEWPACAGWTIVSGNRIVAGWEIPSEQLPQDVFMADGAPPVIQAEIRNKDRNTIYFFLAFEPFAVAEGRIRALTLWIVPCGTEKKNEGSNMPEVTPFEGFSPECVASSKDAILRAAAHRPAKDDDYTHFRWIRFEPPPPAEPAKPAPERGR